MSAKGVLDRVMNLDRRVIFALMAVAVVIPFLWPIRLPEYPTPMTQAVFDFIESLPRGSLVLVAFDYDPSTAPELDPMASALARHCMTRDLALCTLALWPEGQGMASHLIAKTLEPEFPHKVYGLDYVNLGYKAGGQGLINAILSSIRSLFTTDVHGTPADSLPLMQRLKSLKDFALIVSLSAGKPGAKEWVQFAGDPGGIPVAIGTTAVQAPLLYPYYPSQIVGLLGGLKGAAEYEAALSSRYPRFLAMDQRATRLMAPQAMAHFLIMALILLGNLAFFLQRRARA